MRWRGSMPAKRRLSKCASSADSAWKRRQPSSRYRRLQSCVIGTLQRPGFIGNSLAGRTMDSKRWKQVDSLLQAVQEHPPERREAFLRRACGGDAKLEQEVRSLLVAQQEAGTFLESPAIEVAARALALTQDQETPDSSSSVIG